MSKVIRLEIDTDGFYTAADKDQLLENFLAFIQDEDPDAIEGTESIDIRESSAVSDDDAVTEKAIELIKKGTLSMKVVLSDSTGEALFDTGDVPVDF